MHPLAAIVMLPLAAAAYDYTDPTFWMATYRFPPTFCARALTIEVSSFEKAEKDLAPCGRLMPNTDRVWEVHCRLPQHQAEALAKSLKSRYRVTNYNQGCQEPELAPELDYKRTRLKEETAALELESADLPAISGLLEAQRLALDRLIWQRDQAKLASLGVVAVLPDTPGAENAYPGHREEPRYNGPNPDAHPWTRHSVPPCLQIGRIDIELEDGAGAAARTAVTAAITGLGLRELDGDCPLFERPRPSEVYLTSAPMRGASPLAALKGIKTIDRRPPSLPPGAPTDDEKFAALNRDFVSLGARLEKAPHIKALLRAELDRLKDRAVVVRRLHQGTLFVVRPGTP